MKEQLSNFLTPKVLGNSNEFGKLDKPKFDTTDKVFILSESEAHKTTMGTEKRNYPSDWVLAKNIELNKWTDHLIFKGQTFFRKMCSVYLRSSNHAKGSINMIRSNGLINPNYWPNSTLEDNRLIRPDNIFHGVRPNIRIACDKILAIEDYYKEINLRPYSLNYNGASSSDFRLFELGEYPIRYVGKEMNHVLETAYTSGLLKETGKKYTEKYDQEKEQYLYTTEYEYLGNKYIRTISQRENDDCEFLNQEKVPAYGSPVWILVKPIKWIITNWDRLPKTINHMGTGQDSFVNLITKDVIVSGIPFYPNIKDENCSLWQNSSIRGYLNGINVSNITENGNLKFTAPSGGDFTKQNFLTEALSKEYEIIKKFDTINIANKGYKHKNDTLYQNTILNK